MAEFVSKQNTRVAAQDRRVPFNLSHKTITTQDFCTLAPISVKEVVPGDNFDVKVNSFVRLAPLPCPTYGDIRLVNRAFYVPYRVIMRQWQQFQDNVPFDNGYGVQAAAQVPRISARAMYEAIVDPEDKNFTFCKRFDLSADVDYDFKDNQYFYQLNDLGRRLKSLLVSLGYQIIPKSNFGSFSLLPLLAYVKIYYDWYIPSQFESTYFYLKYFNNPGNLILTTKAEVKDFFVNLPFFEPLEKDYFTTAFLEPNGSNPNQLNINIQSELFGFDGNDQSLFVTNNTELEGIKTGPSIQSGLSLNSINTLTQYGLDTLKAVDQYAKRNQLLGNRYVEQMLGRYGIKLNNILAGRSEYLGYTEQRISIGEVMSTADTSPNEDISNLGDYAGRGVGSSFSNFKLNADEFGLFIVLSCIQVNTGYVHGYKRETVLHLKREDFFTPEYDALGTQPISRGEIWAEIEEPSTEYEPKNIFGWVPRYAEYKSSLDVLAGDFVCAATKTGMDSWHLFRFSNGTFANQMNSLVPDLSFMSGNPFSVYNRFNRIFNVEFGADHFISVHDINIKAYRKMKSLSDSIVTEGSHEVSTGYAGNNF